MLDNRSIPRTSVIPELGYADPRSAADWLCAAFGFKIRLRIANHRVQLAVGEAAIVITEQSDADARAIARAQCIMVRVEDATAHCKTARQAGAKILHEPADQVFGERQYSAEDFAGRQWVFTQSIDDVAPESWGGELLQ